MSEPRLIGDYVAGALEACGVESEEPKKRYMLYSHETVRPNFNCRLSPFSHAFISSLAKTREVALGRAVDFIINEYLAVRELHERLKENKKTLQFLKRCEKGDET